MWFLRGFKIFRGGGTLPYMGVKGVRGIYALMLIRHG